MDDSEKTKILTLAAILIYDKNPIIAHYFINVNIPISDRYSNYVNARGPDGKFDMSKVTVPPELILPRE